MGKVHWTEKALRNVQSIVGYIAEKSPMNAEKVFDRIIETPTILETFPRLGGMVPEFEIEHIREILVYSFRIVYVVKDENVDIIAVTRGASDLTKLIDPANYS
jgi:toxin ParE1/3/4